MTTVIFLTLIPTVQEAIKWKLIQQGKVIFGQQHQWIINCLQFDFLILCNWADILYSHLDITINHSGNQFGNLWECFLIVGDIFYFNEWHVQVNGMKQVCKTDAHEYTWCIFIISTILINLVSNNTFYSFRVQHSLVWTQFAHHVKLTCHDYFNHV